MHRLGQDTASSLSKTGMPRPIGGRRTKTFDHAAAGISVAADPPQMPGSESYRSGNGLNQGKRHHGGFPLSSVTRVGFDGRFQIVVDAPLAQAITVRLPWVWRAVAWRSPRPGHPVIVFRALRTVAAAAGLDAVLRLVTWHRQMRRGGKATAMSL